MQRVAAGASDIGRRRTVNEDAYFFDNELGLYVVADGMGGHAAGEVASQQAVDTVHGMVKRGRDCLAQIAAGNRDPEIVQKAMRLMESSVQAATYMIFGIAQHEPERHGMGTTVSALAICGSCAVTAQVGDSRIYLIRNGNAVAMTEDHTLVAWQLKQGLITEEEAEMSPHRNVITRAVGSRDYVQVDTGIFDVEPGDRFVICSDGMHGYLSLEEVASVAQETPDAAARQFIDLSNQRGGKDNITAIVVHVS